VEEASSSRRVAFAAPFLGKIISLDPSEVDGEIPCQKDAFLAAACGASIMDHFSELVDPRLGRNRRHKLIDIIVLTVCETRLQGMW
jgi:uncharacterized protein (AIM24 family)